MDKLYKYGLTKLFLIIASEVVKKYGVATRSSHEIFPFRFNLIAFAWRV
jgi:hypothetical protein